MKLKKRNKINPSFSMSSMTDLVFLLLVFFMVTSTMAKPDFGLKMELPKSSTQAGKVSKSTVLISADLEYYLVNSHGEKIDVPTVEEIEPLLKQDLDNNNDEEVKVFWLQADKQVPIDEVVKVMDIAQRNNYKMVLATAASKR